MPSAGVLQVPKLLTAISDDVDLYAAQTKCFFFLRFLSVHFHTKQGFYEQIFTIGAN